MQEILISSYAGDAHAEAVLWGLRTLGHPASLWQVRQFPASQALSIAVEPGEPVRHVIETADRTVALDEVRTVWNRRPVPPELGDDVDPRDREFAQGESEQHLAGFLTTACPGALWVNPPAATGLDTNKPWQLQLAREAGFSVPATLFSNAPDRVAAFFARHGGNIVYKSYRPQNWREGDEEPVSYTNYTAAVTEQDLGKRDALAMCPGIFQERIDKAFELRVTAIGNSFFCVRIDAPHSERARLDWRSERSAMRLSPFPLPDAVRDKCRSFMKRFGIVFGCFDFIVAPSGDWYFLEVNPMGQFLWQEERLPELPMLDAMCAFLISADPDFARAPPPAPLAFEDYRKWAVAERIRRMDAENRALVEKLVEY